MVEAIKIRNANGEKQMSATQPVAAALVSHGAMGSSSPEARALSHVE